MPIGEATLRSPLRACPDRQCEEASQRWDDDHLVWKSFRCAKIRWDPPISRLKTMQDPAALKRQKDVRRWLTFSQHDLREPPCLALRCHSVLMFFFGIWHPFGQANAGQRCSPSNVLTRRSCWWTTRRWQRSTGTNWTLATCCFHATMRFSRVTIHELRWETHD